MEKNKGNKIKRIGGVVLTSVLFAATTVGAGFSFYKTSEQVGGVDTSYNNMIRVQANVKFKDSNKNIKDAANLISNTLDFIGMQNSTVRTIGDDKVIVTNPIESYTPDEFKLTNSISDVFDTMNEADNAAYKQELVSLFVPIFFDGTIDIRDKDGNAAFVKDENQYVLNSEFAKPEDTSTSLATIYSSSKLEDAPDFFDEAKLTHSNGLPVIEVKVSKKGKDGDEYINMFKDLNAKISSSTSSSPVEYVTWFNYQATYDIVDALDHSGLADAGSLYTYVSQNENLRPLYINDSSEKLMSSKYDDTIELKGNFTEQQAKYFVRKINSSNQFSYSNFETALLINLQNKIMLIVLASILVVFILIVIFAFVAYFGLLGLIASAMLLLISLITGLLYSGTGILVTGLGLISIGIIIAIAATMIYYVLDIYKSNNSDKFLSVSKVAFDKLSQIQSKLFAPVVAIVVLLYTSGLVLPILISAPLYLMVIGIVISYVVLMIILLPILYVFDLLTKFTRIDYDTRWDYLIGFNNEASNNVNDKVLSNKTSLVATMVAIVLVAITVVTGGVLYGTTGSAVNNNVFGNENYAYVVKATEDEAYMTLEKESEASVSWGFDQFESFYNSTSSNANVIKDTTNAKRVETVRFDSIDEKGTATSPETEILSSFGYVVYTSKALDSSQIDNINNELSKEDAIVLNEQEASPASTNFELVEGMSWDGKTSTKIIVYTNNQNLLKTIEALLIMTLVASILMLFVGSLGVSIATLVTTLIESGLLMMPIALIYLPFSSIVLFPMVLLMSLSLKTKVSMTREAKLDEISSNRWSRASKRYQLEMIILTSALLFFELFLFGIYSAIFVATMIVITIIGGIILFFTHSFIFPFIANYFDGRNINAKRVRLEKDIQRTKNKKDGEIEEEYIKGVNM